MVDQDCIFCKIIAKTIPAQIIAQNDQIIVIEDIAPKAPIHYLIIPKIHLENIKSLDATTMPYATNMVHMAQELSSHLSGNKAFRLMINDGADAGQKVFHLHMHFLSGVKLSD